MTRKEFIEYKGWDKETAKRYIKGFWNFDYWWEYQDAKISLYELLCETPFYKLNVEYNKVYSDVNSDGQIGSTYDWLERIATDEEVAKYLKDWE